MRPGIGRSYPACLEWARIVPYRWRGFHRWWATVAGFFWLPCPSCGREFGGHEWQDSAGIPDPVQPGTRRAICPLCTFAEHGPSPAPAARRRSSSPTSPPDSDGTAPSTQSDRS